MDYLLLTSAGSPDKIHIDLSNGHKTPSLIEHWRFSHVYCLSDSARETTKDAEPNFYGCSALS